MKDHPVGHPTTVWKFNIDQDGDFSISNAADSCVTTNECISDNVMKDFTSYDDFNTKLCTTVNMNNPNTSANYTVDEYYAYLNGPTCLNGDNITDFSTEKYYDGVKNWKGWVALSKYKPVMNLLSNNFYP